MTSFALTYDYRCPFARIAHLHVVEGLASGADWDVRFSPFSLGQAHVEEGDVDVWDEPERDSGLLALQVSVTVRDRHPDAFLAVHRGLFDLRHVHARDLNDREALSEVLRDAGLDPDAVFAEVADGDALSTVRREHEAAVDEHQVWGVPTFIAGGDAVFVRLMEAPDGDAEVAVQSVERILDMLTGWPQLNEFKHTALRR